ncbi:cyclic nucleotide-binding domain-containing protein [Devosia sp.]|uniref:Crp/Fnr family transcriptional regulator n=1 Tax=Devosia sp. TaxID=1871048 RepID=UPI003266E1E7
MRLDDAAAVLSYAEFFTICDDEQKRLLAFSSERRRFDPDDIIYKAGDPPLGAHVLIAGTLKVKPNDKASKSAAISEPGSVVSAISLILSKPRPITITAVIDCETLFVPRAAFLKLCQQSPDLAERAAARIQTELETYLGALEPVRGKMRL